MRDHLESERNFMSQYRRLRLKNGVTPADTLATIFLDVRLKGIKNMPRELHRQRSQLIEQIIVELDESPASSALNITPKRKYLEESPSVNIDEDSLAMSVTKQLLEVSSPFGTKRQDKMETPKGSDSSKPQSMIQVQSQLIGTATPKKTSHTQQKNDKIRVEEMFKVADSQQTSVAEPRCQTFKRWCGPISNGCNDLWARCFTTEPAASHQRMKYCEPYEIHTTQEDLRTLITNPLANQIINAKMVPQKK